MSWKHIWKTGKLEEVSVKENVHDFSVDCDGLDKSDILNIHMSLMIKNNLKHCLDLLG